MRISRAGEVCLAVILIGFLSSGMNSVFSQSPGTSPEKPAVKKTLAGKKAKVVGLPAKFTVVAGQYGTATAGTDLTRRLQEASQDDLLVVFVESSLAKNNSSGELFLRIKTGTKVTDQKYGNRKFVFLDSRVPPEIPQTGLVILDAFYGTGIVGEKKMVEIKSLVEEQVDEKGISIPVKELVNSIPDPAFGFWKAAIVHYALNGTVQTAVFEEDQKLEIVVGDPEPADVNLAVKKTPEKKATTLGKGTSAAMPKKGVKEGSASDSMDGTAPGQTRSDNELKIAFCWCPAGKFKMGSPPSELERNEEFSRAQEFQVEVTLTHGFWMGKYELTQDAWEAVMHTTLEEQREKALSADSGNVGPRFPMFSVSHAEAVEFCARLTKQERDAGRLADNWEYRLPTEAQWEYACRAGTKTATHYGNSLSRSDANFNGEKPYGNGKKGPKLNEEEEVGKYKPNAWGLYDMHGNVDEWCLDCLSQKLPGGTDPAVLSDPTQFITRGGSCYVGGRNCRSASRNYSSSESRDSGFRVALVFVPSD